MGLSSCVGISCSFADHFVLLKVCAAGGTGQPQYSVPCGEGTEPFVPRYKKVLAGWAGSVGLGTQTLLLALMLLSFYVREVAFHPVPDRIVFLAANDTKIQWADVLRFLLLIKGNRWHLLYTCT